MPVALGFDPGFDSEDHDDGNEFGDNEFGEFDADEDVLALLDDGGGVLHGGEVGAGAGPSRDPARERLHAGRGGASSEDAIAVLSGDDDDDLHDASNARRAQAGPSRARVPPQLGLTTARSLVSRAASGPGAAAAAASAAAPGPARAQLSERAQGKQRALAPAPGAPAPRVEREVEVVTLDSDGDSFADDTFDAEFGDDDAAFSRAAEEAEQALANPQNRYQQGNQHQLLNRQQMRPPPPRPPPPRAPAQRQAYGQGGGSNYGQQQRAPSGVFRTSGAGAGAGSSSSGGGGANGAIGGAGGTGGGALRQRNLFGQAVEAHAHARPAERGQGLLVVTANRAHSSGNGTSGIGAAGASAGPSRAAGASSAAAGSAAAKKWDRTARAASGPAWQRERLRETLRIAGLGDAALSDDEPAADWDEGRAAHPLASVGLYAQGVRGSASVDAEGARLQAVASAPGPMPMKQRIDEEAAKTWVYPTNMEKRDYQFNIVSKALFNNVLVALPTGLGKTFIAAVVILNFFRWYPEGKIIFVAPTRPLVNQQQQACHGICGLPWDVAIELTGEKQSALREEDWKARRIFYMTPQTLENDLKKGSCDARDVVCLVVDEAHRATGKYSYTTSMQLLMAKNPYFRVLALSATPGKDPETVQTIIDNLHLNAIEIRTDDAIDIRSYIHRKTEKVVHVPRDATIESLKDKWAKLMEEKYLKTLRRNELLRPDQTAERIKPYTLRTLQASEKVRHNSGLRWLLPPAQAMAAAMTFLLDASAMLFRDRVLAMCNDGENGRKGPINRGMAEVADVLTEVDTLKVTDHFYRHPKLDKLREVLEEHFNLDEIAALQDQDAADATGGAATHLRTRAMVFASSRESVDEIVANLNAIHLDACRFVGQSNDRNGSKGMAQGEQKRVIKEFREGKHRVLVATSIGEEGLDIGEIDLIVCYDATADPIRLHQRLGRTGRKRDGKVVLLVTEGRDDNKHGNARDKHSNVLKSITNGRYDLYDDVERMVPTHIHPTVRMERVPQPKFDPSMIETGRARSGKGAKKGGKKAAKDPMRGMPADGMSGFAKASELAGKAAGKRKASSGALDDDTSEDDISFAKRVRPELDSRTTSMEERRAGRDDDGDGASQESPDSSPQPETRSGKLAALLNDSDDDVPMLESAIKRPGVPLAKPLSKAVAGKRPAQRSAPAPAPPPKRAATAKEAKLSDFAFKKNKPLHDVDSSPPPAPAAEGLVKGRMHPLLAQLLEKEKNGSSSAQAAASKGSGGDSRQDRAQAGPSKAGRAMSGPGAAPLRPVNQNVAKKAPAVVEIHDSDSEAASQSQSWSQQPLARSAARAPRRSNPVSDSDQDAEPLVVAKPATLAPASDDEPLVASLARVASARSARDDGYLSDVPLSALPPKSTSPHRPLSSQLKRQSSARAPAPSHSLVPPVQNYEADDTSPLVGRRRRQVSASRVLAQNSSSQAEEEDEARPKEQRAEPQEEEDSSAVAPRRRHKRRKEAKRKIRNSPRSRALFQYEADRSTDEEVHGEHDENDEGINTDSDSEDDRLAVGQFEATQAPKGYDQQGVYMRSMLTQAAPTPFKGGKANIEPFPGVGGRFGARQAGGEGIRKARRPVLLSSDAALNANDDDRYSMDSFVAGDDEIEYEEGYNGHDDSEL